MTQFLLARLCQEHLRTGGRAIANASDQPCERSADIAHADRYRVFLLLRPLMLCSIISIEYEAHAENPDDRCRRRA